MEWDMQYILFLTQEQISLKICKAACNGERLRKEYALYEMVEHMAPEVIGEKRRIYKGVNANVDFTVVWYMECLGFQKRFIHRFCGSTYRRLECTPVRRAEECG